MTEGQFLMPIQLGMRLTIYIKIEFMSFAKWIGAGIGWTFGGPIGAIIGFAAASYLMVLQLIKNFKNQRTHQVILQDPERSQGILK